MMLNRDRFRLSHKCTKKSGLCPLFAKKVLGYFTLGAVRTHRAPRPDARVRRAALLPVRSFLSALFRGAPPVRRSVARDTRRVSSRVSSRLSPAAVRRLPAVSPRTLRGPVSVSFPRRSFPRRAFSVASSAAHRLPAHSVRGRAGAIVPTIVGRPLGNSDCFLYFCRSEHPMRERTTDNKR